VTVIEPLMLLRAYAIGVFPMSNAADDPDIFWVEPRRRAILPLDGIHLSHSLRKTIRGDRFTVTADRAFEEVLRFCAEVTEERQETWINRPIFEACLRLHAMGNAHSIECWDGDALAGGLYGITLGRAFFGESMFSRRTDASKVALAWLVARLRVGGYTLLDCQFMTEHLASLGAVEISAARYSALLEAAVAGSVPGSPDADAGAFDALDRLPDAPLSDTLTVSGPVSGQAIVQLLTQTS
jgi:leucyl/phenylalanyl-tRNA--protein transferase